MSTLAKELPSSGGRVTLELSSVSSVRIDYRVGISTPGERVDGRLSIEPRAGEVELEMEGVAPVWLCELARQLARGAWRARGEQSWPPRITRWRPEPKPRGVPRSAADEPSEPR